MQMLNLYIFREASSAMSDDERKLLNNNVFEPDY